jgi:glycerophosphoryl diester phosphodiesterase
MLEIKVDAARPVTRHRSVVLALLTATAWPLTVVPAPDVAAVRELRPPDIATCAVLGALARGTSLAELTMPRAAGAPFIGVERTVVDAAAVAEARKAGIGIGAWTVNDAAEMQRVIDSGAAILITDKPDLAKTLLKR